MEQEKEQQHLGRQPLADEEEGGRTLKTEGPTDEEAKKEQSQKQKIKEEREQMRGLSKKELIKVALMTEIDVTEQTVL